MNQLPIKSADEIDSKLPFLKVLAFYYKPTTASVSKDIQDDVFNKAITDRTITKKLINETASILDEIESGAEFNKNRGNVRF